MPALLICISQPGQAAHPNARAHWAAKAKAVAKIREEAALGAMRLMGRNCPNWPKAWLRLSYGFPRAGRRDPDNLIAWAKGVVDGLVDAGLMADDNAITWAPVQVVVKAPRCLLVAVASHSLDEMPEDQVRREMEHWEREQGSRRPRR